MVKQHWLLLTLILMCTFSIMYIGFNFDPEQYSYKPVTSFIVKFSWLIGVCVFVFFFYCLKKQTNKRILVV